MEVNMEATNSSNVSRDAVLKLMDQKDKIEKEIAALTEVLASNRVGLHDSLVDEEGYPRQDIDVYQVRHARHQIICLQNDHKALMKEIEKGLYALHSGGELNQHDDPMDDSSKPSGDPIAVVNKVTPGSPASIAGLEVHDKIIEFGSVKASNFQSLLNIGFVAESCINRSVPVVVLRDKRVVRLSIVPKPWMGPGLLGCNIVNCENVDR
ncbi:26S proteasome non-ATPase regulatory subunit 9 [Frankliniella fusca]|uniref:26S proteasome non-ATPase regulatory subunit 9 n=1 Tax=Frankliniella fusca TaxID=407009 RepID=A0AAE1LNP1_9NEOP|nr:26S proteasome non-ATPase regulatory subunit 9 [Frankliniella fusca]